MNEEDYAFYEDQKGKRAGKCLDDIVALTPSDQMYIQRSKTQLNVSTFAAYYGGSDNTLI